MELDGCVVAGEVGEEDLHFGFADCSHTSVSTKFYSWVRREGLGRGKRTTKFALHLKQHLPILCLRIESLMQCQQLIPQAKKRSTLRIGEFFAVGEGKGLPAALDHFDAGFVGDVEGVAGEGPDFLFHDEGRLFGEAVGGVYA